MHVATTRLGLARVPRDGFADAGFLLLRPPVGRPGRAVENDVLAGAVGEDEVRGCALLEDAFDQGSALGDSEEEVLDSLAEDGVVW